MTHPLTTQYHHTDPSDNELSLEVTFHYTPADPGRLFGPPEHCYPSTTAEVEIISISLLSASTPESRQDPMFPGTPTPTSFSNPSRVRSFLDNLLPNKWESPAPAKTPIIASILWFFHKGGILGKCQPLIPVEISDLLSSETLDAIEATCFEEVERLRQDQEPESPDWSYNHF